MSAPPFRLTPWPLLLRLVRDHAPASRHRARTGLERVTRPRKLAARRKGPEPLAHKRRDPLRLLRLHLPIGRES